MSSTNWRLIPYLETFGAVQMAIDGWLFEQFNAGKIPPTLRFYGWNPAAISLGRFQKSYPDHWQNLTWQNKPLDLVFRPSGGRAVLHQGGLTYAVIGEKGKGKRWETYEQICQFLILGWQRLGIDLNYGKTERGYIHNASCFNTATAADLIASDGSKLIGSAQYHNHQTILQHGSMVWDSDRKLFEEIFEQSAPWEKTLKERLNNLELDDILTVLSQAACDSLGITLNSEPLNEQEWQEINFKIANIIHPESSYLGTT